MSHPRLHVICILLTQHASKTIHVMFSCTLVIRLITVRLLKAYVKIGLEFCQLNSLLLCPTLVI